jgi:hypothetical protein
MQADRRPPIRHASEAALGACGSGRGRRNSACMSLSYGRSLSPLRASGRAGLHTRSRACEQMVSSGGMRVKRPDAARAEGARVVGRRARAACRRIPLRGGFAHFISRRNALVVPRRARSSIGQSRRLITAWLQVRVLPGPPPHCPAGVRHDPSTSAAMKNVFSIQRLIEI